MILPWCMRVIQLLVDGDGDDDDVVVVLSGGISYRLRILALS